MTLGPRIRAWLELVRLPNLFTVPGDPLVGYLLAGGAGDGILQVVPVLAASVLLYAAGLIFNDIADCAEDSRARSKRPLPSGRISKTAAWMAGAGTALAGIVLAAWCSKAAGLVACVLLVLVLLYDFASRRIRPVGIVNMGVCRGASILLGTACLGRGGLANSAGVAAAVGLALYILAVSWIAIDETRGGSQRCKPWLVWGALVVWLTIAFAAMTTASTIAIGMALAVVVAAAWPGVMRGNVPATVGFFVRLLLPAQAVLCAAVGGTGFVVAAVLLVLWQISTLLGRRFYSS